MARLKADLEAALQSAAKHERAAARQAEQVKELQSAVEEAATAQERIKTEAKAALRTAQRRPIARRAA